VSGIRYCMDVDRDEVERILGGAVRPPVTV
jgi:hypothetical protein